MVLDELAERTFSNVDIDPEWGYIYAHLDGSQFRDLIFQIIEEDTIGRATKFPKNTEQFIDRYMIGVREVISSTNHDEKQCLEKIADGFRDGMMGIEKKKDIQKEPQF